MYHIQASILWTQQYDGIQCQSNLWAKILSSDLQEVVDEAKCMSQQLYDQNPTGYCPKTIISIIKHQDEDNVTIQKLFNSPGKLKDEVIKSCYLYDGECYREDF